MKSHVRLLDVLDKAESGPIVEEKNFDKLLSDKVKELTKKFGLKRNKEDAIVTEDDVYGIYFDAYEFACDCVKGYDIPDPCDGWPETSFGKNPNLNSDFLNVIKQIRADLQKAIVITCATRCRSCNTYWGGVWDSLHLEGIAIDCYCPEMDVVDFAFFIWNNYGIPCRVYPSQGFVHVELSSLGGVFNQEKYYFM